MNKQRENFDAWIDRDEQAHGCSGLSQLERDQMYTAYLQGQIDKEAELTSTAEQAERWKREVQAEALESFASTLISTNKLDHPSPKFHADLANRMAAELRKGE
jgi:hypothetical protein